MATLYIVATPIGNLKDITLRALETLAMVDIVAAEDTRVTQKLFNAHGISTQLVSYHQHNTDLRDQELLTALKQGKNIALVTDAGTPLISDPGHTIVPLSRQNNIDVIPIPGACAAITALCVNDFNITRYVFEGFLPSKKSARIQRLQAICLGSQAIIFYEAKHRIQAMLEDLLKVCKDRRVIIARELTKMHEQITSGLISEVIKQFEENTIPSKGEFVVILEGAPDSVNADLEEQKMRLLFKNVAANMSHKDAVNLAKQLSDLPKNTLYQIASEYY